MKIQRPQPTVLHVTLSTYEMATLMAAVRWVVEGREGTLTAEALDQLQQVLDRYEREMDRLRG